MKVKLLVKLGELILGKAFSDSEERADMYLPIWLLAFSLLLLAGGVFCGVLAFVNTSVGFAVGLSVCLGLGITALLCWKNQSIKMLSDETFEYTTFLGKKMVYRFDEIKGLKQNNDSMTLFVADGKVHMESCAIISDRLADRINKQLEIIYKNEQ